MLQYSKLLIYIAFLLFAYQVEAQNCNYVINGYVYDSGTDKPLEYVNVFVEELMIGTTTDSIGYFELKEICEGHLHISLSHIGCEAQNMHLDLAQDTTVKYYLDHTDHVLHEVSIVQNSSVTTTQSSESINKQYITDNASENLSDLIAKLPGVSSLSNGNGISKPVIHGLFGNRLTILNNGVVQAGQQWGNDHSPEIDPLIANNISVIKGVNAITYMNGQLGAIVLVEPGKINKDPHAHGRVQYFHESNGRSHGINVQLQKYAPQLAWRVNGTLKRSGDKHAPDYFLNNTGSRETNLAVQLERVHSDKLNSTIYLSTFNAELGVLRGSNIGSITDLEEAIGRDIPFFTEDDFSYGIDAPSQKVNHHLAKLNTKYFLNDNRWIDFSISTQINDRKEFDVRRSGRSEVPALSLLQYMSIIDVQYNHETEHNSIIKSGFQGNYIDNTNNPETGVLPLIPDYTSYNAGIYTTYSKSGDHYNLELGIRYDLVSQNVAAISNTRPRMILRFNDNYHNISSSVGYKVSILEHGTLALNTAYAVRNPAINERFSTGLHQGVGGIEEGDVNLGSEKSFKSTLSLSNDPESRWFAEGIVYHHHFNDYIYLQPESFRLTVRGAFPVFQYEQTDARIFGIDLYTRFDITSQVNTSLSASYIDGQDLSQGETLINIPSNNVLAQISYATLKPIKVLNRSLENIKISVENRYSFTKTGITEEQDFLAPPDGYNLLSIDLTGDIQLAKSRLRLSTSIDNLFNVRYRDYLNRQRYFSDDIGRNINLGLNLRF